MLSRPGSHLQNRKCEGVSGRYPFFFFRLSLLVDLKAHICQVDNGLPEQPFLTCL